MFKFKSSKTATIVKYLRARIPENMEQQRQRIRKNIYSVIIKTKDNKNIDKQSQRIKKPYRIAKSKNSQNRE